MYFDNCENEIKASDKKKIKKSKGKIINDK